MSDKHLRAWFVVFVVAVFMAGAGGGLILGRYVEPRARFNRPGGRGDTAMGGFAGRGRGPGGLAYSLSTELNLTPEQKTKLDGILAERQARFQQIQGELTARFESEQRDMRSQIEKILTPEQRKRFDQWVPAEGTPGLIWRGRGPGRGRGMGPGMAPGRGMGPGPGGGRGPGL
jgi:hypothetical protein